MSRGLGLLSRLTGLEVTDVLRDGELWALVLADGRVLVIGPDSRVLKPQHLARVLGHAGGRGEVGSWEARRIRNTLLRALR